MSRIAAGLIVVALGTASMMLGAAPAGAVTAADVEAARQRLREVSAELEEQVTRYEAAVLEDEELRRRLDQISADLADRERQLVLARRSARERIAEMYMAAGSQDADAVALLAFEDFSDVPARLAYLDTVAATDREVVNQLEAARLGYERQLALLGEVSAEQATLRAEVEQLVSSIYTRLEEANVAYQAVKSEWDAQEAERIRREEEARRQRELELFLATSTTTTTAPATTPSTPDGGTVGPPAGGDATTTTAGGADSATTTAAPPPTTAPPPAQPGLRVCPVDGAVTFRDSWGEPRPGGRSHTGTDMMAPIGTPLVAIESGTVTNLSWHYAGGLGLDINGDSGDRWYYAHMDGYAAGIGEGTRVAAGQLVGYVGDTGNASVPHLHLAYIPGGDGYHSNPFPIVASLCW